MRKLNFQLHFKSYFKLHFKPHFKSTFAHEKTSFKLGLLLKLTLLVILMLSTATISAKEKSNNEKANRAKSPKLLPIYAPEGLGAGGYDPVAYFKAKKPIKGKDQFVYRWKGVKWKFSSKQNLTAFKGNPLAYYPQYGGHCAYGVAGDYLVKGDPLAWTVLEGKLYLNYDKSVRRKWLRDTAGFLKRSEVNWPDL